MELIIDGSRVSSEKDFHEIVAKELELPDWYGKNLDALWDVLTGMVKRPLKIIWLHSEESKKILPRYEQIISLLRDVESQDKKFERAERFTFEIR